MLEIIKKIKDSYEDGFTLAEMLVAMAIFVVAVAMISGIFVRSVRSQRQANHLMVLNSDAALVIERMAREIREGYDFVTNNPGNCGDEITFNREINGSETQVEYRLNSGDIERSEGGSAFTPLNSSVVDVRQFCFLVTQNSPEDPWRLTMIVEYGSNDQNIDYTANLQTVVTARSLPCEVESGSCAYQ